jgi:hypothetical protein
MVYSELFSAVKTYLARPNLPEGDFTAILAGFEGDLQRVLRAHDRNIVRGQFTQVAGDPFIPLPVNFVGIVGLYINGVAVPQFPADMREDAAAGGYIQKGACLELFPTPTEDTVLRMDYYGVLPPLVPAESVSTNWVLTLYPDVYLYGCLREAAVYLRDDERLGQWAAELDRRMQALSMTGWAQGVATAPRVRMA